MEDRARETHLDSFRHLQEAFSELKKKVATNPISLADVEDIAKAHGLEAHDLLTRASLEPKMFVDYHKGEVRWLPSR